MAFVLLFVKCLRALAYFVLCLGVAVLLCRGAKSLGHFLFQYEGGGAFATSGRVLQSTEGEHYWADP